MLNKRSSDFTVAVLEAERRLGRSATRIADEIIASVFPRTVEEASIEGAYTMFRRGVIIEVKRILTRGSDDDDTIDMVSIDPSFGKIVGRLKRGKYFVEGMDEYVPVAELIRDPALLFDAWQLMRRKGNECLAEAKILSELFEAVTGQPASAASGEREG